jgi:hypothetical protein
MQALTISELTREKGRPICGRADGSRHAFIWCRRATFDYFRFDELPVPQDHGVPDPSGKYQYIPWASPKGGCNGLSLRIAYEWPSGKQKPLMTRFRLTGDVVKDTVQVITDHLNKTGVEWLYIANKDGNRLSRSAFHSDTFLRERNARALSIA